MAKAEPGKIVSVRELWVGFGDHNVLTGLSLDVHRGEVLGVVGGSGSGKSVLLRTIIGLLPKRSGTIEIFGKDTDTLEERERRRLEQRWGILFQQGALFSSLTVAQNLQFQLREVMQLPQKLMDEMAVARLEMVGLKPEDGRKMPYELSGGMIKRASIARALALDPEFLLLDEPTSGLDPISAGELDELIRTLQQTLGLTVFMVTHDLGSLHTICDRIAVLADGRVVETGPLSAMLESRHPWVQAYFLGKRGRTLVGQEQAV